MSCCFPAFNAWLHHRSLFGIQSRVWGNDYSRKLTKSSFHWSSSTRPLSISSTFFCYLMSFNCYVLDGSRCRKPQYCYRASTENSSSQAHTFSFLFHTELYYYYGAVSCHTAHSKVLDTEVVKHGTRRRKEKLDSALILDFGSLWPTIGLLLQTWKRLQKRSHECKETVAVPQ